MVLQPKSEAVDRRFQVKVRFESCRCRPTSTAPRSARAITILANVRAAPTEEDGYDHLERMQNIPRAFVSGAPARRWLQCVAETSPRESIRSVEKPGQGRDRGWMSRQPFLALCDVHVVCCHPQEPVADLDLLLVIGAVRKIRNSP